MKILVINGPNLNFLGIREKGIYGNTTYQDLVELLEKKGREVGGEIVVFQSNHGMIFTSGLIKRHLHI